uniref:InlB B-repeat-containing protein n=1 Tax=Roseburia sp. TaxID=2049040 RepID=UPI003FEF0165
KWVEHRHTFKNEWSSNDTSHWHAATCEHTTEKKDEAAHVYGTAGAERYTCSVCKYVSETRKKEAEAADKNIKYTITYNTNGGSQIAEEKQTSLPDPLPATTKDGYEFAGWYTDADFTTIAQPGQVLTADTTLYAKWVEHRHTFKNEWSSNDTSHWHAATCEHTTEKKDEAAHVYGTAGAERYTCSVCKYVSETRKKKAEATDKKNTKKVKRTEANDAALNLKFNVKAGKKIKVTWGKVKNADGYDVYMAYCGKDRERVVKSVKGANNLSVTVSKLKDKQINQKKNIKCRVLAYKKVNGKKVIVAKSIMIHVAGKKNESVTDAKSIKLNKTSYVLTKGKKATIKASTVKKDKKRTLINHTPEFRYATTDSKVAVVSEKGKITAKGKGSCSVYVYAPNGCAQKIKVVVK